MTPTVPKERPQRIQLSRKRGWKKPDNTIVVARPSKWGNPYRVGGVVTQEVAVGLFRFMATCEATEVYRAAIRHELRGKNLACWCKLGTPCHADVLLEIANT